jgi:dTDP-4-dehydrorhamnose reductase
VRILLLGKNGQVGWELQRSLAPLGDLVALDRSGDLELGLCGDLQDLEGLRRTVRTLRPDVVVNAAAHTAVDRAQSEPDLARRLNAEAPAALAEASQSINALLVHYSTDYVFDGSGTTPWIESAPTGPQNVYGRTKLEGEQAITDVCSRHLILRTSWVFAARGSNFAKTILRLGVDRERLTVINDQHGAPTGADLIADISAHAIRQTLQRPQDKGLYHLAASGETTWNGYARFVVDTARLINPDLKLAVKEVAPVPTSSFPTPAQRPHNSRLDTSRLCQTFGVRLPCWTHGVARMLSEIL